MKIIAIYPNDDFVKVTFDNETSKTISWLDFMSNFQEEYKGKVQSSEIETSTSLKLPANTFVLEYTNQGKDLEMSSYFPETKATIKYRSSNRKVYLPNIIITTKLRLSKDKLWALKSAHFIATHKRYEELGDILKPVRVGNRGFTALPMPNMYDTGLMCYGSNSIPGTFPKDDLSGISWMYTMLTDSAFNADLSVPSTRNTRDPGEWITYIGQGKHSCFPYWNVSNLGEEASTKEKYLAHRKAMEATFGK